jgi:hypothetical protein
MRLLTAVGQPGAALRQYHELERILARELGTPPEAATQALARTLERAKRAPSLPDPLRPRSGEIICPPLAEAVPPQERDLVDAAIPSLPAPAVPGVCLEPVGGVVPLDSAFYVVRPVDAELQAAIARRESLVLLKGARQMGKTSLLIRGLQQAREAGATVLLSDCERLAAGHLASATAFFQTLTQSLAVQLDVQASPPKLSPQGRDPGIEFERFLRRQVLAGSTAPIVWGLDGADRLFPCSFAGEVFGLIRSWYNARSLDPSGPWSKLMLAIAYATEAHLFITDQNQSPFNVGIRLTLTDFSFEQLTSLNRRYSFPLKEDWEIARFFRLVGGHPYLVRRGLHEMAVRGIGIHEWESWAERGPGSFADHLRGVLVALESNPELTHAVREVLRGRPCPTEESFYRLRSAGIIVGETLRDARPRCQLYASYLERHLL